MLKVKQVFDNSEQRFVAEKIRVILAESGIRVGRARISAIGSVKIFSQISLQALA